MKTLIKNGRVVTAVDDYRADIFTRGETVTTIRNSVASDPAYGNDSPLYGAMGFVRKSDRASGLTRKAKLPART